MLRSVKQSPSLQRHDFVSPVKYREQSDQVIIEKILNGNTSLFEILMRRYNQRLYRIQRSYISDEEAIKDTLQQTYLKAFKNLDSFRGEAQFSTWITRIAINEALKYLNRVKRYSDIHDVSGVIPQKSHLDDNTKNPEEDMIERDLQHMLEEVVDQLSPKYRSVYIMREVEGMNTEETADCLDISKANAKVRLHRAKKKIREKLEERVANTDIFNFLGAECDRMVFRVMKKIKS
ncbi:MAG: RNA polymerase sigma factor [Balneolaceae bacterium]|nr:RNA polymerase sigma factor [Balneolaceae bacterium]